MKTDTVFRPNCTFEVWQIVYVGDVGTLTFFSAGTGFLASGAAQSYLYTTEALPFGAALREVTDSKGTKVFYEQGFDTRRYVTASEPTFDVYGNVDGYKQTLKRNPPVVFQGQATD